MKSGRLLHLSAIGLLAGIAAGCPLPQDAEPATEAIALEWMHLTLDALEHDSQEPTVEARTLWHVSAAMYEAWAAYDDTATGYFTGDQHKQPPADRALKNTAETLSHAVYAVLSKRFAQFDDAAPDMPARAAFEAFAAKMRAHGYMNAAGAPVASGPQALGDAIGAVVLEYAANDGANEQHHYADTSGYAAANPPLIVELPGVNGMEFANAWQELMVQGIRQQYLTPHWGLVTPFALPPYDPLALRIDPGPPPRFGDPTESQLIEESMQCVRFVAAMDPHEGGGAALLNISPGARGNFVDGALDGEGHALNPATARPYDDNIVPVADFLRVISVYLDGKRFSTPPPWWNEVACNLLRGAGPISRPPVNKQGVSGLEYDVKLFFTLNAALHDAAVAVWDVKREYDFCRPISIIRYLAALGELPLEPGVVELIAPGDPLAGAANENAGRLKVKAWAGPDQGVQWLLGEDWIPYQPTDFVTPPFPGYPSGHTAFARAFAEVMTLITGDPYFPGGLFELPVSVLRFESDLSTTVALQAATYHDLAYDAGFARVFSGVHIASDVFASQPLGEQIGQAAYYRAQHYFEGQRK
jgi:hypothetical protein